MAARLVSRKIKRGTAPDESNVQDDSEDEYGIESKYKPETYSEFDRDQFDQEVGTLVQVVEEEIRKYSNSDTDGNDTDTGSYYTDLFAEVDETNQERPETLLEQGLEDIKTETKTKGCTDCSIKTRVEDVKCLKKGQHISISGEKGKFYLEILEKQVKLYSHHAIVKKVVSYSDQRVQLVLIHFWRKDSKKLAIRETVESFDLKFDELYIIEYKQPRYTPDEIVLRAEKEEKKKINFPKYSLVSRNCEHFATWCVVGEGTCFQTHDGLSIFSSALSALLGEGSKIANFILRLTRPVTRLILVSSDEMAAGVTSAAGHITFGVTSGLYLLYSIVMTAYYIKQYRNRSVCWSCFKYKMMNLWLRFGVFGITSILSYLIVHFALPLLAPAVGIPVLCLLLLLSTALIWLVPKITKKFQSPLPLERKRISALTELHRGDIVDFKYKKWPHYLIVTDVEKNPHLPDCGHLKGIHYSLPSNSNTRVVTVEVFNLDLKKHEVKRIDFGDLNTYSSREVVRRARQRVGETKWNAASNRSDHLCYWAKVDFGQLEKNIILSDEIEKPTATSKILSSLFIDIREVNLMQEMHRGDVIQLRGKSIVRNKGILVALSDLRDGRKFEMQIIMLQDGVNLVKEIVDLNTDNLFIKRYHHAHCFPLEERAQRALAMVGKRSESWTQSGFIEKCIVIPKEPEENEISSLSELRRGDIVNFKYYKLPHYLIITDVKPDPDDLTRGKLKCIHYALPDYLSTRIVAIDEFYVDLNQKTVKLLDYGQFKTFSREDVVRRACRRVGETKWNALYNRSKDLCHWAKMQEQNSNLLKEDNETDLQIHVMQEIQQGDVIQLRGKSFLRDKGIFVGLTDLRDGRKFEMQIIMLKDRVRLVKETVDLNKDELFVRRYLTADYFPPEERAQRALAMVGKRGESWTQSGFIEKCIVIPKEPEENEISTLSELRRGDIVNFKYYKLPHYLIITDVKPDPDDLTRGKLMCIHYSLPDYLSTRVVAIDEFYVDLNQKTVKLLDYRQFKTFSREDVVRRACRRVGETKWNALYNRSKDLCHWAKMQEQNSNLLKGDNETDLQIHVMQEIQQGDVIQLRGKSFLRDKGIFVGLTDLRDGRKFEMQIIMLKDRVRLVKETVDLNKDELFVRRYLTADYFPLEERAQRALAMVDKRSESWTQSGFIEKCIVIPKEPEENIISTFSELRRGDIVNFKYYKLPHYLIITDVKPDPDDLTRGKLKCIHYSLPDQLSKRVVAIDEFYVDLNKKSIKLLDYGRFKTFSREDVVCRAYKRVGETKWNALNNRSEDLCYWAKMLEKKPDLLDVQVHIMQEIQLGDVIKFRGAWFLRNKGILVGLTDLRDGRKFEMQIIMLKDRVRLVRQIVDLNKDELFVRRYPSADCFPLAERAQRALAMIDKKSDRWTQSGFIEDCIFINS